MELKKAESRKRCWAQLAVEQPKFIVGSPLCTHFSVLQCFQEWRPVPFSWQGSSATCFRSRTLNCSGQETDVLQIKQGLAEGLDLRISLQLGCGAREPAGATGGITQISTRLPHAHLLTLYGFLQTQDRLSTPSMTASQTQSHNSQRKLHPNASCNAMTMIAALGRQPHPSPFWIRRSSFFLLAFKR